MTRRSIIRVLLSLLLLMSQQMAISHAMTHWGGTINPAAGSGEASDNSLSKSFAQDQTCEQCLAFAQIAGVLGNTPRYIAPDLLGSSNVASCVSKPACARTVCAFQSRAPPVLS
jgi:hypothetical protein